MNAVLSKSKFDIYRTITNKIVAAIELGAGDFVMPWHRAGPAVGRPVNAVTNMAYRGINVVGLWAESMHAGFASGHWASYRQWQKVGAQVTKGATGSAIVFFKQFDDGDDMPNNERNDDMPSRFVARCSYVFNADQVEGWQPPQPESLPSGADILNAVEGFVARSGAEVRLGASSACYIPSQDRIEMPDRRRFAGSRTRTATEAYYAVLLHELVHWTGAKHRLDRTTGSRFGTEAYAGEELVAELGSAFLCADLHVANEPRQDHASYVASWLRLLKNDSRAIFHAAALANRAAMHLHELSAGRD